MNSILKCIASLAIFAAALHAAKPASAGGFSLRDQPGEHLDVLLDGRPVARYMYALDKSSPERLHDTYKPYLHVFDAEGKAPITKGPGGQFTHHRGIFIGWNKVGFNGKTYDRWHMKGGEIVHQNFSEKTAGKDNAAFTSVTHWNDETGKPILIEERTMALHRAPAPAYVQIDFSTRLKAVNGDVKLDGDPEHSGVHFRPANEVVAKETVYVFPKEKPDPKKDADYPWVGETFTLDGRKFSVVHMNHPGNPKGTVYSAYRDYGRFGAFFKHQIEAGQALELNYRFLVNQGPMPEAPLIQKVWDQFAGVANASPIPKVTMVSSAAKASAPKKAPAKTPDQK